MKIGEKITLKGWVNIRRDHGKIIFIDLRSKFGILQCVFTPHSKDAYETAEKLRPEWVVEFTGEIKERPEKLKNTEKDLGDIEMEVESVEIISESETPPFGIDDEGYDINEELRLKYRYLDLRRSRMKENIIARYEALFTARSELHKKDFIEIETPILTKSTPEGARDFVVPYRKRPGTFYALPQSPQQYKQMLMVAGFSKYFQLARCFRDEDTRADRQPEFTQLDMELSFTTAEEIQNIVETLITEIVNKHYGDKKVTTTPWPKIDYKDAMEKYKSDSPDIRNNTEDPNELGFAWIVNFPLFEEEKENGHFAPSHHMFTSPVEEDIQLLDSDPAKVRSLQYDLVLNGSEIGGGSIRIHKSDLQKKIFDLIGFSENDKENFKHMLTAFEYGVPPHGGFAIGIERLLLLLRNEKSVREVMAFPKTGEGEDPLMETPSEISDEQLGELGVTVKKSNKEAGK